MAAIAVVACAFRVKQLKVGIAIADRTERTETTITNSIKENPSSFLSTCLIFFDGIEYLISSTLYILYSLGRNKVNSACL